MNKSMIAAAPVLGAVLVLSACHSGGSGSAGASARAEASSAAASLAASPQVKQLENEFLSCVKTHHFGTHAHRVATIHCMFPKGDTAKIENYALQTASITVLTSKPKRLAWLNGVATYAAQHTGTGK